jgi:hypothetical protein
VSTVAGGVIILAGLAVAVVERTPAQIAGLAAVEI